MELSNTSAVLLVFKIPGDGVIKVATSAEQQISFICGKFNFVLGQPQSAGLSEGVV